MCIDGSKVEILDTPTNRERFGSNGNQYKKIARVLLPRIYDIKNYCLLDVKINRVNSNETDLAIFEFIEGWHNRKRIHSVIGYKTPYQLEDNVE